MQTPVSKYQRMSWRGEIFPIKATTMLAAMLFILASQLANHYVDAQTLYGSIVGTVTDTSGAVIPNATVTATNIATNGTRDVSSNVSGMYTLSTVPAGIYTVHVSKNGFKTFQANGVEVAINATARVDAALAVGRESESISVNADTAVLETDRVDLHGNISSEQLTDLPQPTRTFEGLIGLLPGVTPPNPLWAAGGGTNNPDKSMILSMNGTSQSGAALSVDGVSSYNPWVQFFQTAIPSTEAIETVNVVTASSGADEGIVNGGSVRVQIKSGTNSFHGEAYWYNIINALEAKPYFTPSNIPNPKYIDNNAGGTLGGPVMRNKLFFFGSYEGDFVRQAAGGFYTLPTPNMTKGILASPTPIYDPATGNADGSGRTQFPRDADGNYVIPSSRFAAAPQKLISLIPSGVAEGAYSNNIYISAPIANNLQKVDTKGDWDATSKLRLSGRYSYHPYKITQVPVFGDVLGNNGNNDYANGDIYQAAGMATYVASPNLVMDGLFGLTHTNQFLFPPLISQRYCSDTLGIPGTNLGQLPLAGGVCQFSFSGGLAQFGYGYPYLTYQDPVYDFAGNVTWVKKNHSIRFGVSMLHANMNHQEVGSTGFNFSGGVTGLYCPSTSSPGCANGSPAVTEFNSWAQFLLGIASTGNNNEQTVPWVASRAWQFAPYISDTWQMNRKTTLYIGTGWDYFPVPKRPDREIETYDALTNQVQFCGMGPIPKNCGIAVQKTLFSPRIGIAYRLTPKTVFRAGYSLAPEQISMTRDGLYNYPIDLAQSLSPTNSYTGATTLAQGLPTITPVDISSGSVALPATINFEFPAKNFVRGYTESYNLTAQREIGWGMLAQVGYVGTLTVHQHTREPINYGQVGGGEASQPLFQKWGNATYIKEIVPLEHMNYKSVQAQIQKKFSAGLQFSLAYTWSQLMGLCCDERGDGNLQIAIPQYQSLNWALMPDDRTNNLQFAGSYQLPFGKDKKMATTGPAAVILGGWQANWVFSLYSGSPFSVTDPGTSLNAPFNSQMANKVKSSIAIDGFHYGKAYFDTSAFAPVATATFGNAGWDKLRGPGFQNLDFSVFRTFSIWERLNVQFRAEALNLANHPNFGNPDGGITDNAFGQIWSTNPGSRGIAQRYMRLGTKFTF